MNAVKEQTRELLKTGKAKAKARLRIAIQYVKNRPGTYDLLRTAAAKHRSRSKIVREYFSGLHSY